MKAKNIMEDLIIFLKSCLVKNYLGNLNKVDCSVLLRKNSK